MRSCSSANVGNDTMGVVLGRLFRLDPKDAALPSSLAVCPGRSSTRWFASRPAAFELASERRRHTSAADARRPSLCPTSHSSERRRGALCRGSPGGRKYGVSGVGDAAWPSSTTIIAMQHAVRDAHSNDEDQSLVRSAPCRTLRQSSSFVLPLAPAKLWASVKECPTNPAGIQDFAAGALPCSETARTPRALRRPAAPISSSGR